MRRAHHKKEAQSERAWPFQEPLGFPQGWRAGGEERGYDSEEIALLFARIMSNFVK